MANEKIQDVEQAVNREDVFYLDWLRRQHVHRILYNLRYKGRFFQKKAGGLGPELLCTNSLNTAFITLEDGTTFIEKDK